MFKGHDNATQIFVLINWGKSVCPRFSSQLIEPPIMMSSMKKETSERKAHAKRARAIIQQLRDEMNAWLGWGGMSEPQAIGEYLVELTDMDIPLDTWLVESRKAYEEWKTKHPVR